MFGAAIHVQVRRNGERRDELTMPSLATKIARARISVQDAPPHQLAQYFLPPIPTLFAIRFAHCREEMKRAVYKSWINGIRGADETYEAEIATKPSAHARSDTLGSNNSSSSSLSVNPPSSIAIERKSSPPTSPRYASRPSLPMIKDDAEVEMESLKRMWSGLEAEDGMRLIRKKVLKEYVEMTGSSSDDFVFLKKKASSLDSTEGTYLPQTPSPSQTPSIIQNITSSLASSPAMGGFLEKFKGNVDGTLRSFMQCHASTNQPGAVEQSPSPRILNALNSVRKGSARGLSVDGADGHISHWILQHSAATDSDFPTEPTSHTILPLPRRVADMLEWYYPSLLLLEEVGIREGEWAPESRCDIRALAMPERQYFGFRREGKVVSRLVQKYASAITPPVAGLHRFTSASSTNSAGDAGQNPRSGWTLCFRNSTFGGEFVETLLQTLYRNQSVENLCFVGKSTGEESSNLLSHLVGSLPKSIGSVVFDRILSGKALGALSMLLKRRNKENKVHVQLHGLAITNTDYLKPEDFEPLWDVMGRLSGEDDGIKKLTKTLTDSGLLEDTGGGLNVEKVEDPNPSPNPTPLLPLLWLDLANNKLGDAQCATLLNIVLLGSSSIESLNLNGNNIKGGSKFVAVLEKYVKGMKEEDDNASSIYVDDEGTKLRNLYLDSNNLARGVVESVLNSIEMKGLDLERLSLAENGIQEWGRKWAKYGAIRSLLSRKTSLVSLNLSNNLFTSEMVDGITFGLYENDKTLTVLKLENNNPPITQEERDVINAVLVEAKSQKIKLWLSGGLRNDLPVAESVEIVPPASPLRSETTGGLVAASKGSGEGENNDETLEDLELDRTAIAANRTRRSRSEPVPVLTSTIARAREEIDGNNKDNKRGGGGIKVGVSKTDSDKKEDLQTANLNSLTVLFSAPLVFRNAQDKLQPIEMLAFDNEREIVCQCFREASRDIDLKFDTATVHRLRTSVTLGCRALHYSGHGHENFLTFEDGKGGLHAVNEVELRQLCGAGATEGTNVEFVFVSACYSKLAGEAFVGAGVSHVVCCQQDLLQDSAALAFTRAFYLALAVGRTVRDSFEIGKQAVNVSPSVPNAEAEMEKFLLLPEGGNHDVQVFKGAKKVGEWTQRGEGGGGRGGERKRLDD